MHSFAQALHDALADVTTPLASFSPGDLELASSKLKLKVSSEAAKFRDIANENGGSLAGAM